MNNPINLMNTFLSQGGDARALANNLVTQNPQMATMLNQMRNMAGGMTPKDFAMQLAKQKGINPNELQAIANRMGIK